MALTYANRTEGVHNNKRTVEIDCIFDSAYVTGGEPLNHAAIGLKRITRAETVFVNQDGSATDRTTHGWNIVPVLTDTAAVLLKAYATTDTETASEADMSLATERFRFYGP